LGLRWERTAKLAGAFADHDTAALQPRGSSNKRYTPRHENLQAFVIFGGPSLNYRAHRSGQRIIELTIKIIWSLEIGSTVVPRLHKRIHKATASADAHVNKAAGKISPLMAFEGVSRRGARGTIFSRAAYLCG
jgi:hypothetical protein